MEIIAAKPAVGSRDQKSIDDVVDVVESAQLLAVSDALDFFAVDRLFDKPADEALARVLHELTRSIRVDQPERYRRKPLRPVILHADPFTATLTDTVHVDRRQEL